VSTLPEMQVSQARLVAGQRSITSAVARFDVQRQRGRDQRPVKFYVLAMVERDAQEALAQAVAQAVGECFEATPGSLTARLMRAAQAGSALLLQENLSLVSQSPRNGGVACVVVRQDDVYLAQVGDAAAAVCSQGALSCLLRDDPNDTTQKAFGRRRDPDVRLAYHALSPGDALLLVSSELIRQAGNEEMIQALSVADAHLALDGLAAALPTREGAALVITASRPAAAASPTSAIERRRPAAAAEKPPPSPIEPEQITPAGPKLAERLESFGVGGRRLLGTTARVAGDWLHRLTPGGEGPYRGRPQPADRKLRRQTAGADHPLWRWVALGLPVLVVLVVLGAYWKRGFDRQVQHEALVAEVQAQLEIAATADETAARQALETALLVLDGASDSVAQSQEIVDLQQDVQRQLDTLNRVVRLSSASLLHTYPVAGSVDQLVVQGVDVYVLDRLTDRVYHHRLDETGMALQSDEETLLVRKGDQPGDSAVVGDLVGLAWMAGDESGQGGALLILGQNGQLLTYNPAWGRLTGTMLPAAETWQYPVAVASYMGNLYVLDAGLGQVLRYRDGGASFDSAPEPYFTAPPQEITTAIDLAIDGFVYLLLQDGQVKKYLRGEPLPLTLEHLDRPLERPAAVFGTPDDQAQFLYLADPIHSRVLRCAKEGLLVQQFVLEANEALSDVRDIFVDEVSDRVYFVAANQLYVMQVPAP